MSTKQKFSHFWRARPGLAASVCHKCQCASVGRPNTARSAPPPAVRHSTYYNKSSPSPAADAISVRALCTNNEKTGPSPLPATVQLMHGSRIPATRSAPPLHGSRTSAPPLHRLCTAAASPPPPGSPPPPPHPAEDRGSRPAGAAAADRAPPTPAFPLRAPARTPPPPPAARRRRTPGPAADVRTRPPPHAPRHCRRSPPPLPRPTPAAGPPPTPLLPARPAAPPTPPRRRGSRPVPARIPTPPPAPRRRRPHQKGLHVKL